MADEERKPAKARKPRAKKTDGGNQPGSDAAGPVAGAKAPEASVYIGQSAKPEYIWLRLANRHGLITGATGTGKTVTLQGLAESFSDAGVPVFCADVKGDLSGVAMLGKPLPWIEKRAEEIGWQPTFKAYPVIFWDLFGKHGLPIKATVFEMGPLLLSRLMDLNDVQEGVLNIAFKLADEEEAKNVNFQLVDLKDLQAWLEDLAQRADELTTKYGNISKASIGAIQRALLVLEQQGGNHFFGEPALKISDLMQKKEVDSKQRGYISILVADRLMEAPRIYATFLLFLLSELFEKMDEVGDPDKPKLVFFFDEAHLLFKDVPKALLQKVEQVVRLIRSKGVGVYFVTQNPLDIPDTVSSQLGNRIQHALRAFTPTEQKAVKAAATTFRANPNFNTEKAIMELGVGEALVSTLDEKGQPTEVQRTLVRPPSSRVGPIKDEERAEVIKSSKRVLKTDYTEVIDRESAYELLKKRVSKSPATGEAPSEEEGSARTKSGAASRSDSFWTTVGKTVVRTGLPIAMRLGESFLKNLASGKGGKSGYRVLDTGEAVDSRPPAKSQKKKAEAEQEPEYVPFKSINVDERGILGGIKRR